MCHATAKAKAPIVPQPPLLRCSFTFKHWDIPCPFAHKKQIFEAEGLRDIHKKSFQYNVLLEIRDARVPDSSHHPSFQRLARHRLHLIFYTHADLIDGETKRVIADWTRRSGMRVVHCPGWVEWAQPPQCSAGVGCSSFLVSARLPCHTSLV